MIRRYCHIRFNIAAAAAEPAYFADYAICIGRR